MIQWVLLSRLLARDRVIWARIRAHRHKMGIRPLGNGGLFLINNFNLLTPFSRKHRLLPKVCNHSYLKRCMLYPESMRNDRRIKFSNQVEAKKFSLIELSWRVCLYLKPNAICLIGTETGEVFKVEQELTDNYHKQIIDDLYEKKICTLIEHAYQTDVKKITLCGKLESALFSTQC